LFLIDKVEVDGEDVRIVDIFSGSEGEVPWQKIQDRFVEDYSCGGINQLQIYYQYDVDVYDNDIRTYRFFVDYPLREEIEIVETSVLDEDTGILRGGHTFLVYADGSELTVNYRVTVKENVRCW